LILDRSIGTGADPGLDNQLTGDLAINPALGFHYLLSAKLVVIAEEHHCLWPVPTYTAWWQRQTGV